MARPGYMREQWDDLLPLLSPARSTRSSARCATLDDVVAALTAVDERRATGKILFTP